MPPNGLTFSGTTEVEVEETDEGVTITIDGGPVLADDIGDFVLSIEVPDEVVKDWLVTEEPPSGWPFQEFWLPDRIANNYMASLTVHLSQTGEEVDAGLLSQPHSPMVTERFSAFLTETGEAAAVGALCTCGERWRWGGRNDLGDPRIGFARWTADHID